MEEWDGSFGEERMTKIVECVSVGSELSPIALRASWLVPDSPLSLPPQTPHSSHCISKQTEEASGLGCIVSVRQMR